MEVKNNIWKSAEKAVEVYPRAIFKRILFALTMLRIPTFR